jgi:aspartate aminotransferase
MRISEIARTIGESVTLKLNATANRLRQDGEPVIHLGGGEPKSKAPREAVATACELLETGEIRYAPADGIHALKTAIAHYTELHYGHLVEPGNVMASGGAKQAIMVALQAVLDPGDEVVYPAPYWVSYPDMVRLCGATPVAVLPPEGSFVPRLEDLERKVGSRTRAMILNSPNNPSGVMYPAELVAGVVELCERRGLYLIMDDIYHRLVFDGRRWPSPYEFAREKGEDSRLIVVNGVSKQYAMTGFRVGWAVAARGLIEVMGKIQGHQTSGPSSLTQWAAVGALNGSQESVEHLRLALEANRNVLMEQLASFDGVRVVPPDGTFYAFADFRAFDEDSTRLANFLLEKVRVLTVPGLEFGMEGFLRISFCGGAEDIVEGIRRMKWALLPGAGRELTIGERTLVRDWD